MADADRATLVAHIDCDKVSREELFAVPVPEGTSTFKPVSHKELVMTLEVCLQHRGISIVKEQFAVRADGSRMFAAFDLSLEGIEGTCGALGLRTGNDRTMKLQMITGMRVFICDNMAFSGDVILLDRKHTGGLDLMPELYGAVGRFETRYAKLRDEVTGLKELVLQDTEAKALIHDIFVNDIMPIRYLPNVSHEYFNPTYPEFQPGNAWSLMNAFTFTMKEMTLNRRMEATQELGKAFGLLGQGA